MLNVDWLMIAIIHICEWRFRPESTGCVVRYGIQNGKTLVSNTTIWTSLLGSWKVINYNDIKHIIYFVILILISITEILYISSWHKTSKSIGFLSRGVQKGLVSEHLFRHCITFSCSLQSLSVCLYRTGQIH